MSLPDDNAPRPAETRIKELFAAMAVGSILAGCAVYLLQEQLGIPRDTARTIMLVFILAGAADGIVIYFWDRLFKRGR